jgi:hypothetical protein
MKYAVQMGSGAIPSFIKTSSGIQKFIKGLHTLTQTAW